MHTSTLTDYANSLTELGVLDSTFGTRIRANGRYRFSTCDLSRCSVLRDTLTAGSSCLSSFSAPDKDRAARPRYV